MEEYQQHSLWNLIMDHVPESEISEVRSIIGEALIDFYTDLCTEVSGPVHRSCPISECPHKFSHAGLPGCFRSSHGMCLSTSVLTVAFS